MKKLISALVLMVLSGSSLALCDLHGDFAGGRFAHLPQNFDSKQRQFFSAAKMSFRHQKQITTAINQPTTAIIKYRVPGVFKDVTLSINSSASVHFESVDTVSIDGVFGQLELPFVATTAGTHKIEISIAAVNNGSPVSIHQQMEVIAKQEQLF